MSAGFHPRKVVNVRKKLRINKTSTRCPVTVDPPTPYGVGLLKKGEYTAADIVYRKGYLMGGGLYVLSMHGAYLTRSKNEYTFTR